MARTRLITGLDVGTTKVCVVVAEVVDGSDPVVLGVGISPCTGLKKGVVVDLDATTAAIEEAVHQAETAAGVEIHSAVVGITGEHVACINSRSVVAINHPGREIFAADVERLIDSATNIVIPPDREIIHAIPRWYSVDGQDGVHSPVGMHGSRLEVETHIITGLSSFIHNVVKCVDRIGILVDAVVFESIASAETVLDPAEKELGVALVDIGGGTSDVAVYLDGGIFYSCAVPIGGNLVTKDISVGLRTSLDEAERVKLGFGYTESGLLPDADVFEFISLGASKVRQLPRRVLLEIIEPRMAEICRFVLDKIEAAGVAERLPAGLVFTGGGSGIPGLVEMAGRLTGLPVRMGAPKGFSGDSDSALNASCATAAGLVLYQHRYGTSDPVYKTEESFLSILFRRIKGLFTGFRLE